jgi:hypothetical protein
MRNLTPDISQGCLDLPDHLEERINKDFCSPLRVDITPRFTLLDLRVDHGMHAIAAGVSADRVWFLFPPTVRRFPSSRLHLCHFSIIFWFPFLLPHVLLDFISTKILL